MDTIEINRRFEMAVSAINCEQEGLGIYSEGASHVRNFSRDNVRPERLGRTLEGALNRCTGVPMVGVELRSGWVFGDRFGDLGRTRTYAEGAYVAVTEDYLFVAVCVGTGESMKVNLCDINLHAILNVGVVYKDKHVSASA